MRGYLAVFRLRVLSGLQYRTAALAGVMTQFFWGAITIMVLEAFYASTNQSPPISWEQVVAYVWLRQAFLFFIVLWIRDSDMAESIVSGQVAYELARPYNLYDYWFAKGLAYRLAAGALRSFPIIVAALLLPAPYGLHLPSDSTSALLFACSLGLALLISVAITMIMYVTIFVTMTPTGSVAFFAGISDFLAGGIVPLPLMPSWLQAIAYRLPFYTTQDTPFRIYSGHLSSTQALPSIVNQFAWLVGLVLLGRLLLSRALSRATVQGG